MTQAVLITGGAKRVGAALSRYFATQGYDIALHYNSSKAEAEAIQKEIQAKGRMCELFAHDLTDIKGLDTFIAKVKAKLPYCAALINNASVFERATLMQTDEALFDRQFDTNFKAPFFLTQAFAKHFGKGAVINMIDSEISKTQGSHFAYLLSKKVLADFTIMAAREFGPDIRVNGVCPGVVLPSSEEDKQYMERLLATLPLKRHPELSEVAQAAFWLASQPSVTGQLIYVDGGKHVV